MILSSTEIEKWPNEALGEWLMGLPAQVIIGVSGGSASGKTTFSRAIQQALGESVCGIIFQDSYYHDQSTDFDGDGGQVNFDHPSAIDFDLLHEHLLSLRKGEDVELPQYDFATHRRLPQTESFESRQVVILDGILIFTDGRIRQCLDSKVFIQTREPLRYSRRLNRDVKERGRTPEGVEKQFYSQVKPMHDQFVEPGKDCADFVLDGERPFGPLVEGFLKDLGEKGLSQALLS